MRKCPLCDSSKFTHLFQAHDDRYGCPGLFEVNKCLKCDHIYLKHRFSSGQLNKQYSKYYPREKFDINNVPQKRYIANKFLSWIKGEDSYCHYYVQKKSRVIDIGCGYGSSLFYYRDIGCKKIMGIDPDINLERVGRKYNFDISVGLFDSKLASIHKDKYDYAVIDQVIEHVPSPINLLNNIHHCLRKNGKLIIGTPNFGGLVVRVLGKYSFAWHVPYHLQFFTSKSLVALVKQCGYEIEFCKTRTSTEWIYYEATHFLLSIIVGNSKHSAVFYPGKNRTFLELIIIMFTSSFHFLHLDHLFSRLLDYLGIGENIILVAKKI